MTAPNTATRTITWPWEEDNLPMVAKIPADDAAAATAQNYFLERTKGFFPWARGGRAWLRGGSCDKP